MRCPYCQRDEDKVIDSRAADDGSATRRRRECLACGRRYTTWERAESLALRVIKRGGATQDFDRDKLARGISRACEKRDIDDEQIAHIVDDLEEELREEGEEVTTEQIGVAVLGRLRDLDDVAYLRFASVYKDFQSAGEFGDEIGSLLSNRPPGSVLQKREAQAESQRERQR